LSFGLVTLVSCVWIWNISDVMWNCILFSSGGQ